MQLDSIVRGWSYGCVFRRVLEQKVIQETEEKISLLKNSFFIRKRSLLKFVQRSRKGGRKLSPLSTHILTCYHVPSLLITDRKSLFFTDKNQYHISTHLVRETRRHKKHFPHPTPRPGIYSNPIRRFNLLTLPAILYNVVSFSFSLAPPFSSLPFPRDDGCRGIDDETERSTRVSSEGITWEPVYSSKRDDTLFVSRSPYIFLFLINLVSENVSRRGIEFKASINRDEASGTKRETTRRSLNFFGRTRGTRSV